MVVREDDVFDRLVCHLPHAFDDKGRQSGSRLRVHDKATIITDDDS